MSEQPRDKKTGRWSPGQKISPEHIAKMQAGKAARQGLTADLLESVGLTMDNAPAELLVIAKKAASGDTAAMRLWLTQTKQLEKPSKAASVKGGEVYNIVLSQESVEYLHEHGCEFSLCSRCEKVRASDEA